MGIYAQIALFLAGMLAIQFGAELGWQLLRRNRLKREGVDIGTMPWGLSFWYGIRLRGAAIGFGICCLVLLVTGMLVFSH